MKIGLRAGHSDNCTGAIGIVDEHEQMKKYYVAVKSIFEQYGHIVIDCNSNANTPGAELSEGANKANSNNVDLFVSLHMNASDGQGHGVEAWVSSTNSGAYNYAANLCTNFSGLGFTNRGVKTSTGLYEMNHVVAPNIIFEICFCDNETDIAIYNQYSWEQLAYDFCNAIESNIPKEIKYKVSLKETGCIITNYLPNGNKGDGSFEGVDLEYVLSYLKDIKCYARGNSKGMWIETQTLPIAKCNELKKSLGSWFYSIQ